MLLAAASALVPFLLLACGSTMSSSPTTMSSLVVLSPGSKNLIVGTWIIGDGTLDAALGGVAVP